MRNLWQTAVLAAVTLLIGCSAGTDAPQAAVPGTEAESPAKTNADGPGQSTAGEGVAEGQFPITPENSKIEFVGSKDSGIHEGGFKTFSGTMALNPDDLESSRISVEIEMDSTWTDNEKLTAHLKSADFFEVRTYPTAKFLSTKIKPFEGDEATHQITGDLTLHGVTRSISFPATVDLSSANPSLQSEFAISRKEFDITYGPDKVHDEVTIKVSVGRVAGSQATAQ